MFMKAFQKTQTPENEIFTYKTQNWFWHRTSAPLSGCKCFVAKDRREIHSSMN